jgi:hypothetical protein
LKSPYPGLCITGTVGLYLPAAGVGPGLPDFQGKPDRENILLAGAFLLIKPELVPDALGVSGGLLVLEIQMVRRRGAVKSAPGNSPPRLSLRSNRKGTRVKLPAASRGVFCKGLR